MRPAFYFLALHFTHTFVTNMVNRLTECCFCGIRCAMCVVYFIFAPATVFCFCFRVTLGLMLPYIELKCISSHFPSAFSKRTNKKKLLNSPHRNIECIFQVARIIIVFYMGSKLIFSPAIKDFNAIYETQAAHKLTVFAFRTFD